MRWVKRYNESATIRATDKTIREIISSEIRKLGRSAHLNHIDVRNVTDMNYLFWNSKFNGKISLWDVGNVIDMKRMFKWSHFCGDLSLWNVRNVIFVNDMFKISPLEGREPWWYILGRRFIDNESMYQSIEVHEWINLEKRIIWKKRLKYALEDFGEVRFQIPQSIWGFHIQ